MPGAIETLYIERINDGNTKEENTIIPIKIDITRLEFRKLYFSARQKKESLSSYKPIKQLGFSFIEYSIL